MQRGLWKQHLQCGWPCQADVAALQGMVEPPGWCCRSQGSRSRCAREQDFLTDSGDLPRKPLAVA